MLIYFLLLVYPAIFAFLNSGVDSSYSKRQILPLIGFWIFYNFVSAVRDNVAGDWFTYDEMTYLFNYMSLSQAMADTDPGFGLIAWVSNKMGFGLYGTNFFCSAVLSLAVVRLAYRLPAPWLAITAAVPYLLIVVGFGYIRQAAAIGFAVSAICDVERRRHVLAGVQIALAMSFHLSSAIMAPLVIFAIAPRNIWSFAMLAAAVYGLGSFVLSTQTAEIYRVGYLDTGSYSSSGAAVRIAMSIGPAILLILFHKRFNVSERTKQIWLILSWSSVALAAALFLGVNSTAIDRIALYILPLQVFVFGIVVWALVGNGALARLFTLAVIVYCIAVQITWLYYADHAFLWVPYQSLFSDSILPIVLRR